MVRPGGHLGMIFTLGLPWVLFAVAVKPEPSVIAGYLGGYLAVRLAMTWLIGSHGLKESSLWTRLPLIPLWDLMAVLVWLTSFAGKSIRWRGSLYRIENGALVPVASPGRK